jgi:iron complex transport system ATP-binding protein
LATSAPEPVLELDEATVVRNGRRILDGLTLTIRAGEHTAILGPNGSGKTALVNLLTHDSYPLARPAGRPPVRVFGSDRWNVFELRARIGIVSADLHQRFVAGNSMGRITGLDAVLSGFFATQGFLDWSPVTGAMREEARGALAQMEAVDLAHKRLDEMSTGEARRVLIARALVTAPRALVLDEPTSGLDLVARHRFLSLVGAIAQRGTTLILTTHHVEEIVPEIDHVVLLRGGRVAGTGAKRSMLTPARLGALFDAPVAVVEREGIFRADAL